VAIVYSEKVDLSIAIHLNPALIISTTVLRPSIMDTYNKLTNELLIKSLAIVLSD